MRCNFWLFSPFFILHSRASGRTFPTFQTRRVAVWLANDGIFPVSVRGHSSFTSLAHLMNAFPLDAVFGESLEGIVVTLVRESHGKLLINCLVVVCACQCRWDTWGKNQCDILVYHKNQRKKTFKVVTSFPR